MTLTWRGVKEFYHNLACNLLGYDIM